MTESAAFEQMSAWQQRFWWHNLRPKDDAWVLACLLSPASWRVNKADAQVLLRILKEA